MLVLHFIHFAWVKVIMLVCCNYLILGRKICLKRSRKKQAKKERFLKRMKSRGKWKHGRSNVEKVRRLEEAGTLLASASPWVKASVAC
jgi:hypothetical protein